MSEIGVLLPILAHLTVGFFLHVWWLIKWKDYQTPFIRRVTLWPVFAIWFIFLDFKERFM